MAAVGIHSSAPAVEHRTAPTASLQYLSAIHSKTVGLANNHSYDFGPPGLERTRAAILEHGMIPLGARGKARSHPEVRVWRGSAGIRVGFWAAARVAGDSPVSKSSYVEPADFDRALHALECMRRHEAQFCVALLHAGSTRSKRPDPADVRLMDSLAKWGFDVVAASHSHRIGGAKFIQGYRGRKSFCFYGLGNLASGCATTAMESEGLIVVAGFTSMGALARIEVRPLSLNEQGFGEVPSPAGGKTILQRFARLSDEIEDGSYERLFYRDIAQGIAKDCFRDARAAYRISGLSVVARKARLMRAGKLRRFVGKLVG